MGIGLMNLISFREYMRARTFTLVSVLSLSFNSLSD
jgi:hypothetical protein